MKALKANTFMERWLGPITPQKPSLAGDLFKTITLPPPALPRLTKTSMLEQVENTTIFATSGEENLKWLKSLSRHTMKQRKKAETTAGHFTLKIWTQEPIPWENISTWPTSQPEMIHIGLAHIIGYYKSINQLLIDSISFKKICALKASAPSLAASF